MKPRIKMGQLPGDICRGAKIRMMEGKDPDKKRSKSLKKLVRMSEKAVLKRRAQKEIAQD